MSQQGQGVISANDLMQRLAKAKKVMNKVEGGNFERGNINADVLSADPQELIESPEPQFDNNRALRPVGETSLDRINQSKLPDSIKKLMIENPIPQIKLNDTLDMDIINGAKRIMEKEGVSTKPTKKVQPFTQKQQPTYLTESNVDMNSLAVLIENTIRKVLDEKLNQILTAQQTKSINENLVLKVGDSVFKGKITGVNKAS
jgi:hypothetical protein